MQCKTHQRCVRTALKRAEALCRQKNARLTPTRRRVMELVCSGHVPIKAYDILNQLQQEGQAPHPPTVYRALEFLLKQGLIHRLESLNAYVSCTHPQAPHSECYFLVCSICGEYQECCSDRLNRAIGRTVKDKQFHAARVTLEVHGRCRSCTKTTGRQAPASGTPS